MKYEAEKRLIDFDFEYTRNVFYTIRKSTSYTGIITVIK